MNFFTGDSIVCAGPTAGLVAQIKDPIPHIRENIFFHIYFFSGCLNAVKPKNPWKAIYTTHQSFSRIKMTRFYCLDWNPLKTKFEILGKFPEIFTQLTDTGPKKSSPQDCVSLWWTFRSAPLSTPLLIFRLKIERENSDATQSATQSCIGLDIVIMISS